MTKRYRIAAAAHNLGRIMRLLFGIGKPRVLQAPADFVWLVQFIAFALCASCGPRWRVHDAFPWELFVRRRPGRPAGRRGYVNGLIAVVGADERRDYSAVDIEYGAGDRSTR